MITAPIAYSTTLTLLSNAAEAPLTRTCPRYVDAATDGRTLGRKSHASVEFRLIVQPDSGVLELVNYNSQWPVIVTVVFVNALNF